MREKTSWVCWPTAGAGERSRLDRDLTVLLDQEHPVELHRVALGFAQTLDLDHLPGDHPVLLSASRDHRLHVDLT